MSGRRIKLVKATTLVLNNMNESKKGNAPLWLSFTSAVCMWAVGVVFTIIGVVSHLWFVTMPAALVVGLFTNIAIKIFCLGLKHGFKTLARDIKE